MKILSIATFNDWFYLLGTYGPEGVQRMCDLVADSGISRLYLRTHDGGLANYSSVKSPPLVGETVVQDTGKWLDQPKSVHNYVRFLNYTDWDPLPVFLDFAPTTGMEAALWYTVMEDDHGGHLQSDFYKAHPEWRCVDREGEPVGGCLEFWFEEVRNYKLAIIDELLDKGTPRILLDLVRRNGTPSADGEGFYRYGFNPEIVTEFVQQGGADPRGLTPGSDEWGTWLDFVSRPYTEFFVEACRRISARNAHVELLTWPVHLKSWMAIDLEKILDTGEVEAVHVASHAYSYSPADLENQLAALKAQVGSRSVKIVPSICGYEGLVCSGLDKFFEAAQGQGVDTIVVHESDALFRLPVASRFRALAYDTPHYKRELHSRQVETVDWEQADKISGFLRGHNEDSLETDQLTEIQVAHTTEDLFVRVTCHERDTTELIPVPRYSQENYNVRQLGPRLWWNPKESVHLFLSMPGQYGDYFHFLVDPSNTGDQECRLDETWNGEWSHDVQIEPSRWTATFRLPFASLNHAVAPGQRIAFNAVRSQASPAQLSMLNLTGTHFNNPEEFGFLHLL